MAKAAAKNRLKQNSTRLRRLSLLILSSTSIFAITQGFRAYKSQLPFAKSTVYSFLVILLVQLLCYLFLQTLAAPTYSDGQLVDGGEDLSAKGLAEVANDLITIAAIVQVGSLLSRKFFILFAAYPLIYIISWYAGKGKPGTDQPSQQTAPQAMGRKERRRMERERRAAE